MYRWTINVIGFAVALSSFLLLWNCVAPRQSKQQTGQGTTPIDFDDLTPLPRSPELNPNRLLEKAPTACDASPAALSHLVRTWAPVLRRDKSTLDYQLWLQKIVSELPEDDYSLRMPSSLNRPTESSIQSHKGQLLSAFAEAGLPLDSTIRFDLGRPSVQSLVHDAQLSIRLDHEYEWLTVALALYQPTTSEWKNSQGETVSWELITSDLLQKARSRGQSRFACAGTHTLQTLAVLAHVDRKHEIWREATRDEVIATFEWACQRLEKRQLPDGSWDADWDFSTRMITAQRSNFLTRLRVTGHHLEWIVMLPANARPAEEVLIRAADFVTKGADRMSRVELEENVCAWSHGIRALCF
jgi:hypothetical protein